MITLDFRERDCFYWVARDKDGELSLFSDCPALNLDSGIWCGVCITLQKDILPEVTFENSPMKVKLDLIPFGDSSIDHWCYV